MLRITAHVNTFYSDVDNVDVDEVNLSSSADASASLVNDVDTGTFRIVNDHIIEGFDTYADEEKALLADGTKRNKRHGNELEEKPLLTRRR